MREIATERGRKRGREREKERGIQRQRKKQRERRGEGERTREAWDRKYIIWRIIPPKRKVENVYQKNR